MKVISGFIIICLVITLGYLVGLLIFLGDFEKEKCELTYMFEYPNFVKISNQMDMVYPKYELYAYSEGRLTEKARNMYFDGIPVLFIPGNAGSHKQVRSLSSVALRKALNSRLPYHMDYFTVNLNKEYSGLNGALLFEQLDYVNHSMYRVLELYKKRKNPPTSLILIGHSMGGVIAKRLLAMQPIDSQLISIVLTLATPLKRPPVKLDPYMNSFYQFDWLDDSLTTGIERNTSIISISGGFSDQMIPPSSTLGGSTSNTLNVVSNTVPLSWLQANHVQILWCKQLILVLTRAIFDCVDIKTSQISKDSAFRMDVFKHHLVRHSGTKMHQQHLLDEVTTLQTQKADWLEKLERQFTIDLNKGVRQTQWFMIKLTGHANREFLTVTAVNMETVYWAFACTANYPSGTYRACREAKHMTQYSEISPSARHKRRTLRVNLAELRQNHSHFTHLVFKAQPTSSPVLFHVDNFEVFERKLTANLPKWWSLGKTEILAETIEKSIHYEIEIPQLQHVVQSYYLYLEPFQCRAKEHHASASLVVPWSHDETHAFTTEQEMQPLHLRLYNSKPSTENSSAFVQLTLDPSCRYKVSIKSSIFNALALLARHYSHLLIANVAVVILMTFRRQLLDIGQTGQCSLFFSAITEGAKPYYVLPAFKILSKTLNSPGVTRILPSPDWVLIQEENTDFFALPLLLYTCSVGIVWMLSIIYCISLITLEATISKKTLRFLSRSVSFTFALSDHVIAIFHKLPFLVSAFLVTLTLGACGSLALIVGTTFYFLKLAQMSQELIEKIVWMIIKNYAKKFRNFFRRSRAQEEEESLTTNAIEEVESRRPTSLQEIRSEIDEIIEEYHEQSESSKELNSGKTETEEVSNFELVNEGVEELQETRLLQKRSSEDTEENASELEEDELAQEEVQQQRTSQFQAQNALFFHSSVFFLWFLVTLLNLPIALTWAHNFQFNRHLQPDPSFIPGLVLSICALPLWQFEFPKVNKKGYGILGQTLLGASIFALVYTPISLYRLNYLLTGIILMLVLHQLIAPSEYEEQSIDDGDDNKGAEETRQYEEVKAKLE